MIHNVFDTTKKLINKSMKFNEILLNKSINMTCWTEKMTEKALNPSPKTLKTGCKIGCAVGLLIIINGIVHYLTGNNFWAACSIITGIITISSNTIFCLYKLRK